MSTIPHQGDTPKTVEALGLSLLRAQSNIQLNGGQALAKSLNLS